MVGSIYQSLWFVQVVDVVIIFLLFFFIAVGRVSYIQRFRKGFLFFWRRKKLETRMQTIPARTVVTQRSFSIAERLKRKDLNLTPVTHTQENPPQLRFLLVRCGAPFLRLAQQLTFRSALGASSVCLPGR